MPSRQKNEASPASGVDHIGSLPDEILHHLLSFLPAQQAVRTCVLARRWRHLWRFATGLRIGANSVDEFRKFMDHLIFLRERTDLETFEIDFVSYSESYDGHLINLWVRFAIMCKVRTVIIHICGEFHEGDYFDLDVKLHVSRHLKTLHLYGVKLSIDLDFSSCPSLEDLEMDHCDIHFNKISSLSLKHLSITDCHVHSDFRPCVSVPCLVSLKLQRITEKTIFFENMPLSLEDLEMDHCDIHFNKISSLSLKHLSITDCHVHSDFRPCVSVPCLVSLKLQAITEKAIFFENMPLLDTAFVTDPGDFCAANDRCCEYCNADNGGSGDCVLLKAISNAKHLELKSSSPMFISKRHMKLCPTFSKLRTLLLNENWCVAPQFKALTCILKHSPVLEKLTILLLFTGWRYDVEMNGCYCPVGTSSAVSKHLQIVKVKCEKVDKRVLEVLKFLCTFNIRKLTGNTNNSIHFVCKCSPESYYRLESSTLTMVHK